MIFWEYFNEVESDNVVRDGGFGLDVFVDDNDNYHSATASAYLINKVYLCEKDVVNNVWGNSVIIGCWQ